MRRQTFLLTELWTEYLWWDITLLPPRRMLRRSSLAHTNDCLGVCFIVPGSWLSCQGDPESEVTRHSLLTLFDFIMYSSNWYQSRQSFNDSRHHHNITTHRDYWNCPITFTSFLVSELIPYRISKYSRPILFIISPTKLLPCTLSCFHKCKVHHFLLCIRLFFCKCVQYIKCYLQPQNITAWNIINSVSYTREFPANIQELYNTKGKLSHRYIQPLWRKTNQHRPYSSQALHTQWCCSGTYNTNPWRPDIQERGVFFTQ